MVEFSDCRANSEMYDEGGNYFVDGESGQLAHSEFRPIVYTGPCNRILPLNEAVVDTPLLSVGQPRAVQSGSSAARRAQPSGIF